MQNLHRQPVRINSRAQILKSASRLFAKHGFHASSLRQIAADSGVNGALISYYFGGKEGLRDAVILEKLDSIQKVLKPLTEHKGSVGLAQLQNAVSTFFQHVSEDESFHRLAQRSLFEDPEFQNRLRSQLWDPIFFSLSSLLRRATKNKLSQREAETRCIVLCGMIHQYANLYCFFREGSVGSQSTEKTLQDFEQYVLHTLLKEICRA